MMPIEHELAYAVYSHIAELTDVEAKAEPLTFMPFSIAPSVSFGDLMSAIMHQSCIGDEACISFELYNAGGENTPYDIVLPNHVPYQRCCE